MSTWTMPPELEPYRSFISDSGMGIEQTIGDYEQEAVDFRMTPAGRALSVNVQIGLLVGLRAASLLKEVTPCPLEKTLPSAPSLAANEKPNI